MDIFYPSRQILIITPSCPSPVIGYYVYEWRNKQVPFYIGMGKDRRAWNTHLDHVERGRFEAESFTVRIAYHRLTKEAAHRLERRLTLRRTKQGFNLLNKRIPNVSSIST